MKKISVLFTIFLLCLNIIACMGQDEEETAEEMILDRIQTLEDSINDDDYGAFIRCMHSGSQLFDSYNETGLFDSQFDGEEYSFYDIEITVDDNVADVDCLADSSLAPGLVTYFGMQTEGDDWYISVWNEDGNSIFNNYSSP